jgi:hypothetical protein
LYQPQIIDDGDYGAVGGMKIGGGNRSAPVPLCPAQIPYDLTMARPSDRWKIRNHCFVLLKERKEPMLNSVLRSLVVAEGLEILEAACSGGEKWLLEPPVRTAQSNSLCFHWLKI